MFEKETDELKDRGTKPETDTQTNEGGSNNIEKTIKKKYKYKGPKSFYMSISQCKSKRDHLLAKIAKLEGPKNKKKRANTYKVSRNPKFRIV